MRVPLTLDRSPLQLRCQHQEHEEANRLHGRKSKRQDNFYSIHIKIKQESLSLIPKPLRLVGISLMGSHLSNISDNSITLELSAFLIFDSTFTDTIELIFFLQKEKREKRVEH